MTKTEWVEDRMAAREIRRAQTRKHAMPGSQTMGWLLISEVLDDILRELVALRLDTEAKSESEADLGEDLAGLGEDLEKLAGLSPESDAGTPAEKNSGVTESSDG